MTPIAVCTLTAAHDSIDCVLSRVLIGYPLCLSLCVPLESANSQKLMLEYEKYQELQFKSQQMQQDTEKQLQQMDESKTAALEELTLYYEGKMQEKLLVLEQVVDTRMSRGCMGMFGGGM